MGWWLYIGYLQDREEINSALEKMVQIGEELMKKSNAEDHFFWRKMFLETFESVRFILKENYEFELEEGRKRNHRRQREGGNWVEGRGRKGNRIKNGGGEQERSPEGQKNE